ncbi:hypothetical protein J2S71_002433 [Olsenella profusa DSM 13989]|uniref:DUF4012 domain-containing protein n=1 Tax=Olsenella profusa TaxID=138595 RepID=UPI00278B0F3B|nr:DUF4012 domain-containing protein [Olsenella profusa]MDP9860737.1 hypothetical protein [Olsenella profusa DSM 13989]
MARSGSTHFKVDQGETPASQEGHPDSRRVYMPRRGAASPSSGRHGHGPRRRRRTIAITVAGIVVVLLALVGLEAFALVRSAQKVHTDADAVLTAVDGLASAASSGDTDQIAPLASRIGSAAHEIQGEVQSPAWSVAAAIPGYGDDVRSVRALADTLVDVSDNAIIPLSQHADALDLKSLFSNSAINVDALQGLGTVMADASPVLDRATSTIDALPPAHLSQLDAAIAKLRTKVDAAKARLDSVQAILPYLPQMLGANGQTRTYLVVAQNNAELRASGGFPGSVGTLTVSDGVMRLGDFASLAGKEGLSLGATDEEVGTFGSSIGSRADAATLTPNFPRTATLLATAWQQLHHQAVDGVIGIDPVFLQRLLALTGPVTVADGTTLTGDNAAQELENNVYLRYGNQNATEDALFADAAATAFTSIMSNLGAAKATDLMDTLGQSAADGRLQVWMANEDEEQALVAVGASGGLSTDATKPVLGVYVNDVTWAKLAWYLDLRTTVGAAARNADGSTTYEVTTTLGNMITDQIVASAPTYITGGNMQYKRSTGDMVSVLILVAPAGGTISDVRVDSPAFGVWHLPSLYGFDAWSSQVNTYPQETRTITYKVTTSPDAAADLVVRSTPTGQAMAS